jgi:homoserine kinase type II
MATYTELDEQTIIELIGQYDIGQLKSYKSLDGGQANSSLHLVTAAGSYVLSVCDEKSRDEVHFLTLCLEQLAKHNFPTTRVIKTTDGHLFIEYKQIPVYLKHYIAGHVPQEFTPSMLRQLGVTLAQLHEVPPPANLPEKFSYGIDSFAEITTDQLQGEYAQWLGERQQYLQKGCFDSLPRGFIHGDLFYDNTLYQRDKLVAVLDFEEACNYYKVFDLGMCAAGCCVHQNKFSLELTKALVAGYQDVRKLLDSEKQVLQLHIEYGAAATSFWRYRQYNVRYPGSQHANSYREMTDLAEQIRAISEDAFKL